MPERRRWSQLSPWEKAVRVYLAGQAALTLGGVVFLSSGFGWDTPDKKFAAVNARAEASIVRIGKLEGKADSTAALVIGLSKLACKQDRDRAEMVLPCNQLIGNEVPAAALRPMP